MSSWSEAIEEAHALAPKGKVIYHTLEIQHPAISASAKRLDLAVCMDVSSTINLNYDFLTQIVTNAVFQFNVSFQELRVALITFSDTATRVTDFQTRAEFENAFNNLDYEGGTTPDEAGYSAIQIALNELSWERSTGIGRSILLVSPSGSTKPISTEVMTELLVEEGVVFSYANQVATLADYEPLREATGGAYLDLLSNANLSAQAVLDEQFSSTSGRLFLVNQRTGKTLTLEDGTDQYFEPTGFRFTLPEKGTTGSQVLNLAVDDVDQRASSFLENALDYEERIIVRYRPYLSTDTSAPDLDPPLELSLTDVNIDKEITGRAVFADVLNQSFPSVLYRRSTNPTLGY